MSLLLVLKLLLIHRILKNLKYYWIILAFESISFYFDICMYLISLNFLQQCSLNASSIFMFDLQIVVLIGIGTPLIIETTRKLWAKLIFLLEKIKNLLLKCSSWEKKITKLKEH